MQQITSTIVDIATQLLPAAISLSVIGVVVGLAMGVIGYRHSSDVMRGSVIGMIVVLAVTVIGNYFKGRFSGTP